MRSKLLLSLAAGAAGWLLWAQAAAPSLGDLYKAWRELDPLLEKEAAAGGPVAQRAKASGAAAARYADARAASLRKAAEESAERVEWLEHLAPAKPRAVTQDFDTLLATAATRADNDIATYSGDPDPGIQQLRQSLERERAALAALSTVIGERKGATQKSLAALAKIEPARLKALEQYRNQANGLAESAAQADREMAAWAAYYDILAGVHLNGSQPELVTRVQEQSSAPPPAAAPAEQPAPEPPPAAPPAIAASQAGPPVVESPVAATADPNPPRPQPVETASINPPAAVTRGNSNRILPTMPLSRYTGAWQYPISGGLWHGPAPELIDFMVHDENNKVTGSLYGRFKTAEGIEPTLRLEFAGDWQASRNQRFDAETSDGAKGYLELIPGPAFNLLEVNLQIERRPGKIDSANFLVVKK